MASTLIAASPIKLPSEAKHLLTWKPLSLLQVEAAGQEKRASWQKTALEKGEQAICDHVWGSLKSEWVSGRYQLAGTGRIAEASLPGSAGDAVAAVNAGRGDGREGADATKESEHAYEKRGGLHFEYLND
jgi:hypothetical protein